MYSYKMFEIVLAGTIKHELVDRKNTVLHT